jgi:hypothetical protein
MWMSSDGRVNTVALPNPSSAMDDDFVQSLVELGPDGRSDLASRVEDAQERFFDFVDGIAPSEPTSPGHDGLPLGFLRGSFVSAQEIANYVDQIDVHWRLDALMAIEDYLDELDEDEPTSWFERLRLRRR